jgi:hypothetical protein
VVNSKYIYIANSGGRYGPLTVSELNRWAEEGRIGPGSLIEDVETGKEVSARDLPGFEYQSIPSAAVVPKLENPVPRAIVATFLFGFPPAGLIAIFFAVQFMRFEKAGDRARAKVCAEKANQWSNWSIAMAALSTLILVAVVVFGVLRASR